METPISEIRKDVEEENEKSLSSPQRVEDDWGVSEAISVTKEPKNSMWDDEEEKSAPKAQPKNNPAETAPSAIGSNSKSPKSPEKKQPKGSFWGEEIVEPEEEEEEAEEEEKPAPKQQQAPKKEESLDWDDGKQGNDDWGVSASNGNGSWDDIRKDSEAANNEWGQSQKKEDESKKNATNDDWGVSESATKSGNPSWDDGNKDSKAAGNEWGQPQKKEELSKKNATNDDWGVSESATKSGNASWDDTNKDFADNDWGATASATNGKSPFWDDEPQQPQIPTPKPQPKQEIQKKPISSVWGAKPTEAPKKEAPKKITAVAPPDEKIKALYDDSEWGPAENSSPAFGTTQAPVAQEKQQQQKPAEKSGDFWGDEEVVAKPQPKIEKKQAEPKKEVESDWGDVEVVAKPQPKVEQKQAEPKKEVESDWGVAEEAESAKKDEKPIRGDFWEDEAPVPETKASGPKKNDFWADEAPIPETKASAPKKEDSDKKDSFWDEDSKPKSEEKSEVKDSFWDNDKDKEEGPIDYWELSKKSKVESKPTRDAPMFGSKPSRGRGDFRGRGRGGFRGRGNSQYGSQRQYGGYNQNDQYGQQGGFGNDQNGPQEGGYGNDQPAQQDAYGSTPNDQNGPQGGQNDQQAGYDNQYGGPQQGGYGGRSQQNYGGYGQNDQYGAPQQGGYRDSDGGYGGRENIFGRRRGPPPPELFMEYDEWVTAFSARGGKSLPQQEASPAIPQKQPMNDEVDNNDDFNNQNKDSGPNYNQKPAGYGGNYNQKPAYGANDNDYNSQQGGYGGNYNQKPSGYGGNFNQKPGYRRNDNDYNSQQGGYGGNYNQKPVGYGGNSYQKPGYGANEDENNTPNNGYGSNYVQKTAYGVSYNQKPAGYGGNSYQKPGYGASEDENNTPNGYGPNNGQKAGYNGNFTQKGGYGPKTDDFNNQSNAYGGSSYQKGGYDGNYSKNEELQQKQKAYWGEDEPQQPQIPKYPPQNLPRNYEEQLPITKYTPQNSRNYEEQAPITKYTPQNSRNYEEQAPITKYIPQNSRNYEEQAPITKYIPQNSKNYEEQDPMQNYPPQKPMANKASYWDEDEPAEQPPQQMPIQSYPSQRSQYPPKQPMRNDYNNQQTPMGFEQPRNPINRPQPAISNPQEPQIQPAANRPMMRNSPPQQQPMNKNTWDSNDWDSNEPLPQAQQQPRNPMNKAQPPISKSQAPPALKMQQMPPQNQQSSPQQRSPRFAGPVPFGGMIRKSAGAAQDLTKETPTGGFMLGDDDDENNLEDAEQFEKTQNEMKVGSSNSSDFGAPTNKQIPNIRSLGFQQPIPGEMEDLQEIDYTGMGNEEQILDEEDSGAFGFKKRAMVDQGMAKRKIPQQTESIIVEGHPIDEAERSYLVSLNHTNKNYNKQDGFYIEVRTELFILRGRDLMKLQKEKNRLLDVLNSRRKELTVTTDQFFSNIRSIMHANSCFKNILTYQVYHLRKNPENIFGFSLQNLELMHFAPLAANFIAYNTASEKAIIELLKKLQTMINNNYHRYDFIIMSQDTHHAHALATYNDPTVKDHQFTWDPNEMDGVMITPAPTTDKIRNFIESKLLVAEFFLIGGNFFKAGDIELWAKKCLNNVSVYIQNMFDVCIKVTGNKTELDNFRMQFDRTFKTTRIHFANEEEQFFVKKSKKIICEKFKNVHPNKMSITVSSGADVIMTMWHKSGGMDPNFLMKVQEDDIRSFVKEHLKKSQTPL